MKKLVLALIITFSGSCHAITEEQYQRCVETKDMIVMINKKADEGRTKSEWKEVLKQFPWSYGILNFVYENRGMYTNQEIAKKGFEACLKSSASSSRKK